MPIILSKYKNMKNNITQPRKKFKLTRFIFRLFMIIFIGYGAYFHYEDISVNIKYRLKDPGEKMLSANVSENELIYTFDNEIYGKIYLYAGTETNVGLRHILARHTRNYFTNYEDKNLITLFDDEITGGDIILIIRDFYNHCIDVEIYNRNPEKNTAYVGFAKINDKRIKCLLVVRREDKKIVTFYPFNLKRKKEILKEKEEKREEEIKKMVQLKEQELERELEQRRLEIEQQVREEIMPDTNEYIYD